jgi:DNA-binding transcriptional LysR family regulator
MINLNHLYYFYVCTELKSISRASRKVGISQPSMSMQIKSFEEYLGFKLFVRNKKSLDVTPQGEDLFQYAFEIFQKTDSIENYLKKKQHPLVKELKIGVSDEVDRNFATQVVSRYLNSTKSQKKYKVLLVSKPIDDLSRDFNKGLLDLLLSVEKVKNHKPYKVYSLPVLLMMANTKNNKKIIPTKNFLKFISTMDLNLLLPIEGFKLRKEINSFLNTTGKDYEIVFESNILSSIVRATIENLGASLLPFSYVKRELSNSLLVAVGPKEGFWKHEIALYHSKDLSEEVIDSFDKILINYSILD